MRKRNNILPFKEVASVVAGIFVALIILCNQAFYYNYLAELNDTKTKTEISDSQEDVPVIKLAQDAVSSVVQVIVVQALHLISEIVFVDREESKSEAPLNLGASAYFKTLFNIIISPNAP